MKITTLILSLLFTGLALAQTPGFDVYVSDLKLNSQGLLQVDNIKQLTNRPAYDNQPLFLPDGQSLLLTSAMQDGKQEQMDSFIYHLASSTSENLTNTAISEYSPTLMPNELDFSVIKGIGEKQKLWRYPLKPTADNAPSELLKDVNPVGYHAWVDQERVILFVLGEPHTLQLADVSTQTSRVIDRNIGASLYKIPGTELMSYSAVRISQNGQGSDDGQQVWELKTYNPANDEIKILTQLPEGAYYYGWSADGKAITAQGSILKQWDMSRPGNGWVAVADVSQSCPGGATRLTTNAQNSKLAFVCSR